jgi:hypothetical protein
MGSVGYPFCVALHDFLEWAWPWGRARMGSVGIHLCGLVAYVRMSSVDTILRGSIEVLEWARFTVCCVALRLALEWAQQMCHRVALHYQRE